MEQIEKIQPIAAAVSGHRVIVSDKVFSEIINVINLQTEVINKLVDNQAEAASQLSTLDSSIRNLANAIRNL